MVDDPYAIALSKAMDSYHAGLSEKPELFATLPATVSDAALRKLLEVTCRAQHVANIVAGRAFLASLPRQWLVSTIEHVAEGALSFDDEWEYRRLLEVYKELDSGLVQRLVQRGLASPIEEIRSAARDFAGG